jgi:hypothetical protein
MEVDLGRRFESDWRSFTSSMLIGTAVFVVLMVVVSVAAHHHGPLIGGAAFGVFGVALALLGRALAVIDEDERHAAFVNDSLNLAYGLLVPRNVVESLLANQEPQKFTDRGVEYEASLTGTTFTLRDNETRPHKNGKAF